MLPQFIILLPWMCLLLLQSQSSRARVFTLEIHHRFSDPVQKDLSTRFGSILRWPQKGSIEYYSLLARHDRTFSDALTFSDGNATFRISSLGFLHYTSVTLGTPGTKFLVALDTGSDIFWVPCRCSQCTSSFDSPYTSDFELSIYDPDASSTRQNVSCNNELCTHQNSCSETSSNCPYYVSYVSSETSTSGILMEDIIHLRPLDNDLELIKAYVTFGCGQVQTGSFLDVAAPNGLLGLGFEKISVPSILSREGYIANSFSMCFGHDGIGRISFGDKGSLGQEETPFNMNSLHPTYNVTVTQVRVGTTVLDSGFTALFDSGTSFTYIVNPFYTILSESVRIISDGSPSTNTSLVPGMSLTMEGGGQLVVYDPIIVISTQQELVYCLAVVKSRELNIIGQNFMTGYRIVFDREKQVLGWQKFNCYDMEEANVSEPRPANYASMPPPSAVDGLNRSAHKAEPNGITAQNFVASSLYIIGSLIVCLILASELV